MLPALLCNTVKNGSMGVGVVVDGVCSLAPVEPNIAELCAQETLTARCLGTVCANGNFKTSSVISNFAKHTT